MAGRLYLVSTPIGNLGDISFRALEVLRSVDVVLAEDTRHSRRLLDHYEVATSTSAYHEHNEARATPKILERLAAGQDVALISDAGTPLLSDPGARLVAGAIEAGVEIVPVPGASALLAALSAAGLGAERFTFFGFLERRGRARGDAIAEIAVTPHTCVLYEAPGRVGATLRELVDAGLGERMAAVARELTKKFEEIKRGTVAGLAEHYGDEGPRGEVVIVLGPRAEQQVDEGELRKQADALRAEGKSAREIVAGLTAMGATRNVAYRLGHEHATTRPQRDPSS